MTETQRPRRWPHLLLEEGPRCAGLVPGDMIPVELGFIILLGTAPWLPPHVARERARIDRFALNVSTVERTSRDETPGYRIVDDPARVEHSNDVDDPRRWRPFDATTCKVNEYTLRFVLDGPVLGTVRRFGDHVVCLPKPCGAARGGECAVSEWRVIHSDRPDRRRRLPEGTREVPHDILVVEEHFDGEMRWQTKSAPMGKVPGQLRDAREVEPRGLSPGSAARESRAIDKEIAAGIALQLDERHSGELVIGYDGVVRPEETWRGKSEHDAQAFAYLKLTHPWRWDWENYRPTVDELSAARAELDSVSPASVSAIAAMMQALFPQDAARALAIAEECALVDASKVS